MNRRAYLWVVALGAVIGCGDSSGALPAGTVDAVSQAACDSRSTQTHTITSVVDESNATASALVHSDEPTLVALAGPTSYVALEVPTPHTDYGLFVRPAGVVTAASTTALPEEHSNASCPEEALGEFRLHIHEFDHSVLTLQGEGEVWLYFGAAGPPGHGGEGGHGGDEHGHGGEGGHGG